MTPSPSTPAIPRRKPTPVFNRGDDCWFFIADVCAVLDHGNSRQVVSRLDEDERNTVHIADGNRGNPNLTVVNESGLYSLIMTSRVPSANAFKKWVTSEVLPSIRTHGAYIAGQEKIATGEMSRDQFMARALQTANDVLAEMEQRAEAAEQKVVELEPVAAVAEEHFNRGRFTPVTVAA